MLLSLKHGVSRASCMLLSTAILAVKAQQPTPSGNTAPSPTNRPPTPTPTSSNAGLISYTTYVSTYATTLTSGQPRPSGLPSGQNVFLATSTIISTLLPTSSIPSIVPSPSPTMPVKPPSEENLPLHTIIDPAFGILGAFLIITGLILAFIGHRSRWLICLIAG